VQVGPAQGPHDPRYLSPPRNHSGTKAVPKHPKEWSNTVRTIASAALMAVATGCLLVAGAGAAQAAPPNVGAPTEFVCTDGSTVEVASVYTNNGQAVFVDGRGVVAIGLSFDAIGTVTVLDGVHAGEQFEQSFSTDDIVHTSGPNNGHVVNSAALKNTISCTGTDQYTFGPVTLDEATIAEFGLDETYLGASVMVEETSTITAYVPRNVPAKRAG
jgi:hypothetical protein